MINTDTHVTREDYDLCDMENGNLRVILRWVVPLLAPAHREELAAKLSASSERGGVTADHVDDRAEEVAARDKLIASMATALQQVIDIKGLAQMGIMWHQRADYLITQAAGYEPKRPLMKRVGDYPNVYEIVRKM